MKDHEDKVLEGFYHLVGKNHVENIAEELDIISNNATTSTYPNTLNLWFDDYISQIGKVEKKRKFITKFQFLSKRVAILFIIVSLGVIVTTMSVEAFRIKFFNIVTEVTEKYTKVSVVVTGSKSEVMNDWDSYFVPEFIPEGYTLTNSERFGDIKILFYTNITGQEIQFSQTPLNPEYQVDTENAHVTDVTINDEKGILVDKDGLMTMIWTSDAHTFHIIGEIDRAEIIKMAESIKYIKK